MARQVLNERQIRALVGVLDDVIEIPDGLVRMDQENKMELGQADTLPMALHAIIVARFES